MNGNKILLGNDRNALIGLIAVNLIVFVFLRTLMIILNVTPQVANDYYNPTLNNFVMNGNAKVFIEKPWTIFTYFFTNAQFLMLISNMIWLAGLTYMAQQLIGNAYPFPVYIYGGLAGGIVFLITASLAGKSMTIESSATGSLAIAGLIISYKPQQRILPYIGNGGIPIWIIIALFVFIDFLSVLGGNFWVLPAHLAGFGVGYYFGLSLQKGKDWGEWMHTLYDAVLGKNFVKPSSNAASKGKIVPFTKEPKINEARINEILDKINLTGLNSLTKEEKLILQQSKDIIK